MPLDPRWAVSRREARARVALAWLLVGAALLVLTPVDAWTPLLGWGPMLALVVSPLLVLLALDAGLPVRLVVSAVRSDRRTRARRLLA